MNNEQWYELARNAGIGVAIFYGVILLLVVAVFVTVLTFFWKTMRNSPFNDRRRW